MRKINLFINWFDSPVRPQEFDYCLKKNLVLFDRVINLNGRPTFTDFFMSAGLGYPDDINVIANLDIYFDETIRLTKWIESDTVYCLTRHESDGVGNLKTFKDAHGHTGDWSQDAWVFTGINIVNVPAPFCPGERGCDNHLAWLFKEAGYKVLNPSIDIRAIHLHTVDRSASMGRGERVAGGDGNKYLNVIPDNLKMV